MILILAILPPGFRESKVICVTIGPVPSIIRRPPFISARVVV